MGAADMVLQCEEMVGCIAKKQVCEEAEIHLLC